MNKPKTKANDLKNAIIASKKSSNENLIKTKERATNIRKWVSAAIGSNIKDNYGAVKKFLGDVKGVTDSYDIAIVTAIMKCKYNNKKIIFDTSLFNNKLKFYVAGTSYQTKVVTNDQLYLAMLYNRIIDASGEADPFQTYYTINSVKITSDNFKEFSDRYTGYIQDYDPFFSCITVEGTNRSWIAGILENKTNEVQFIYKNQNYKGWGNDDIALVAPTDMQQEDIFNAYDNMKYLKDKKGVLALGIKRLKYTDNVVFFDKVIKPDNFCPAFWTTGTPIIINYLFELEMDYNDLFDILREMNKNNTEQFTFTENLCYWDTLDDCMYFLGVFALTALELPQKPRNALAAICEEYVHLRKDINKVKENQMLLQRILQDFLNCFINDSEYIRFVNLYVKAEKCLNIKKEGYNIDVLNFLNKLPFIGMIKNQLKTDALNLIDEVYNVLGNYINGTNPSQIEPEVRNLATKITSYLPKSSLKDVAFPFIAAPGGLLGTAFDDDNQPVGIIERKVRQRNKKMKEKQAEDDRLINKISRVARNIKQITGNFLVDYARKKLSKTNKLNNEDTFKEFKKLVLEQMKSDSELDKVVGLRAVQYSQNNNVIIPTRGKNKDVLDKFFDHFVFSKRRNKKPIKIKELKLGQKQGRYNLRDRVKSGSLSEDEKDKEEIIDWRDDEGGEEEEGEEEEEEEENKNKRKKK